MHADEAAGYAVLLAHRRLIQGVVMAHAGRVAGGAGDSLLAAFPSVEQAVRAAVALQKQLRRSNHRLQPQHRLEFRVGVHLGDVVEDGGGVYGHSVNLAARFQALAAPGGVAVSHAVYEQVRHRPGLAFRAGGRQRVKHLAEPLPVFYYDEADASPGRSWQRAARLVLVAASAVVVAAVAFAL